MLFSLAKQNPWREVFILKWLCFFLFFGSIFNFHAEPIEYNPWNLAIFERIIHRKHVSHLVMETRKDHYRLSLILSDRFPYNFKSRQYAFFIRFTSEEEALNTSKFFDKQLDSGKEIYIRLDGSEIIKYKFLD